MSVAETRSPDFYDETQIEKVAFDHGWRGGQDREGDWFTFRSTTAPGTVWMAALAGEGRRYALRAPTPGVAEAMAGEGLSTVVVEGAPAFLANRIDTLYTLASRAYRLAMALPDTPFALYRADLEAEGVSADGLGATDAERVVKQRIGQARFRAALLEFWDGRCPLTGIDDPALLRASHIVPWAECETDAQRLDVHNGLLLSALWDAAFDAHLVGFDATGRAVASPRLGAAGVETLKLAEKPVLQGLRPDHAPALTAHLLRVKKDTE